MEVEQKDVISVKCIVKKVSDILNICIIYEYIVFLSENRDTKIGLGLSGYLK